MDETIFYEINATVDVPDVSVAEVSASVDAPSAPVVEAVVELPVLQGTVVRYTHRARYTAGTMYEGVAVLGSSDTDAVWTVSIIEQDTAGLVTSVTVLENQKWSNFSNE